MPRKKKDTRAVYIAPCGIRVELLSTNPWIPEKPLEKEGCAIAQDDNLTDPEKVQAACAACPLSSLGNKPKVEKQTVPKVTISIDPPKPQEPPPSKKKSTKIPPKNAHDLLQTTGELHTTGDVPGIVLAKNGTLKREIITPEEIAAQPIPPHRPPQIKNLPPAPEAPEIMLPALERLGGPRPPIEKLLTDRVSWYTPGGSLLGNTKIKTFRTCMRRGYWEYIVGLQKKQSLADAQGEEKINAAALGTLVHLAIESFYRTASQQGLYAPAEAIKDYWPLHALECRRLADIYLRAYNTVEASTWSVRAVELESRYYYAPRKCAGKRRALGISARHDGVIATYDASNGEAPPPPGKPVETAALTEIKTTRSLKTEQVASFFHDAQVCQGLLAYNFGHAVSPKGDVLAKSAAEILGPTNQVIVTHISKQQNKRKPIPDSELTSRDTFVIPEDRVIGFRDDLEDWLYDELGERLGHKSWKAPTTWPKSWLCKDLYYPGWVCPFFALCRGENAGYDPSSEFDTDPSRTITIEGITKPRKLDKTQAKKAKATGEKEDK